MEVIDDVDVTDVNNFWQGAVSTMERIKAEGKLDEWESFVTDYYAGKTPRLQDINDLLWFGRDDIYDSLGIKNEDEEDEEFDEEFAKAILS